jgi:hypothetical protein
MKSRNVITLVLLGAVAASGQALAPTEAPTGVAVTKYSWHNATRRAGWDAPMQSATDQTIGHPLAANGPIPDNNPIRRQPTGSSPLRKGQEVVGDRRPTRAEEAADRPPDAAAPDARGRLLEEYAYEVRIRNEGAETIEAVEWEYLFVEPGAGKELARHRFHSFRRAKPGKSLKLTGTSAAPPTRVVSAAGAGGDGKRKLFEERIVIKCVIYADGSVRWRDSGAASDCDGIKARAQARKTATGDR